MQSTRFKNPIMMGVQSRSPSFLVTRSRQMILASGFRSGTEHTLQSAKSDSAQQTPGLRKAIRNPQSTLFFSCEVAHFPQLPTTLY